MKKVISASLLLCLVLTLTVSAMPSYQSSSVKMSDTQMVQAVGGDGGSCWLAAAFGVCTIIAGATGNIPAGAWTAMAGISALNSCVG